jgi:hypothetical protein
MQVLGWYGLGIENKGRENKCPSLPFKELKMGDYPPKSILMI